MNKLQRKSMMLSREFEVEVDNLIFKYLDKNVFHADLIRGLSACKLGITNLFIQQNIEEIKEHKKKSES